MCDLKSDPVGVTIITRRQDGCHVMLQVGQPSEIVHLHKRLQVCVAPQRRLWPPEPRITNHSVSLLLLLSNLVELFCDNSFLQPWIRRLSAKFIRHREIYLASGDR